MCGVHVFPTAGFNPRTPAGCDRCRGLISRSNPVFQSTHPCGVRLSNRLDPAGAVQVSIHAPLRGATHDGVHQARYDWRVSIHAPLRGATARAVCCSTAPAFQSTHPCGVRRIRRAIAGACVGFNPRTPAGCDKGAARRVAELPEFQSTHPCGVRQKHIVMVFHAVEVSIHAPLRGATLRTPIPLTRR